MDADNKPIDPVADANTQRDEMISKMNDVMDDALRRITVDEIQDGWQRYINALLKRIRKRAGISTLTPRHINVINGVMMRGRAGGGTDVSGT